MIIAFEEGLFNLIFVTESSKPNLTYLCWSLKVSAGNKFSLMKVSKPPPLQFPLSLKVQYPGKDLVITNN